MTSRRLMQLIEVAATRSGHPNVVFAAISLVVSALTIFDVAIFDWALGCALTQDQHTPASSRP